MSTQIPMHNSIVYGSFIIIAKKWKKIKPKMSFDWLMVQQTVVCPYHGILLKNKK